MTSPARRRRLGTRVACGCVAVALAAVGAFAAAATQPELAAAAPSVPVTFVQEPFTGSQVQVSSDWEVMGVPSSTNAACLTAATSTSEAPVPGCGGTPDTSGQGALRLTGAATEEEGGVASTFSLPASEGIDITFDTYQYASSSSCTPTSSCGADGLMFFLAAADPADPQPPESLGYPGGYLAYSGNYSGGASKPGLADGYLGGALTSSATSPTASPTAVAVRTPAGPASTRRSPTR